MSRPRKSVIAPTSADDKYKGHLFLRKVPETTKMAFKAACAESNVTMRDVMLVLMRKYSLAVKNKKNYIHIDDLHRLAADGNL